MAVRTRVMNDERIRDLDFRKFPVDGGFIIVFA
jgi:hypothetical protein